MDGFLNLAKQGYSAYQDSQGKKKEEEGVKTGGEDYNQRAPSPPGSDYAKQAGGQQYNQGPPPSGGSDYARQTGGQEYNQGTPSSGGPDYSRQTGGQEYNQGPPSSGGPGYTGQTGGQQYNQGPPSSGGPDYTGQSGSQQYNQGPTSSGGPDYTGQSGGQQYNQGPPSSSGPDYAKKTGGQEYNQRAPSPDGPDFDDDDDKIAAKASEHAGDAGDTSLFSQALSFAKGNKSQYKEPVDEASAVDSHKVAYEQDKPANLDANSLGSAAALQVLKQFTSGSGGSSGGGKSQSQLITLAMSEAAKLFDKGGAQSGNKQDAVNGAAMTVVKLLVQSKFSGGGTGDTNKPDLGALGGLLGGGGGGGGGGGSSQLLGMASQYFGKK